MRRLLVPLLLVGLLAALAGCGDEGTATSTSSTGSTSTADTGSSTADTATTAGTVSGSGGGDTIRIAALGDSITAGSPIWDPDPDIRAQIGPALDEQSQFEYWAEEADPALEFTNCGVFGERTDEIAQRLDDCAKGADVLIVQGGINDIAQGSSIDAAAENLQAMVEAGRDAGLDVAITDVLPWNNGHPTADEPIQELNAKIAEIAKQEDVPLLPFYDTLEDPSAPGTMKAEWTIDGDHPSVEGYELLAEQAVLPNLPGTG